MLSAKCAQPPKIEATTNSLYGTRPRFCVARHRLLCPARAIPILSPIEAGLTSILRSESMRNAAIALVVLALLPRTPHLNRGHPRNRLRSLHPPHRRSQRRPGKLRHRLSLRAIHQQPRPVRLRTPPPGRIHRACDLRGIPRFITRPSKPITASPPTLFFFNQTNQYAQPVFPRYPNPLVNCAPLATSCSVPTNLLPFASSSISAFAHKFRIPEVHQVSTSVEHEVANRVIAEVSYSFVHGQKLIRARDMNLPPPTNVQYPVFDSSG